MNASPARLPQPVWAMACLLALPVTSWACGCLQLTPREALDNSSASFIGTVIDRDDQGVYSITVNQAFKGVLEASEVLVRDRGASAPGQVSSCALPLLSPGRSYLIYGTHEESGVIVTGLCSRTRHLTPALQDVLVLEQHTAGGLRYETLGLFMSEGLFLPDWSLRTARRDQLRTRLAELLNARSIRPSFDPSRLLIHNIGTGKQTIVLQVFEASDTTSAATTAAQVLTILEEAFRQEPESIASAVGQSLPGEVDLLFREPLLPSDTDGNRIVGWFTAEGDQVDLDDFFLFAEAFGQRHGGPDFDPLFDIVENGAVDFDDFFRFTDDFGKTVLNAELFR